MASHDRLSARRGELFLCGDEVPSDAIAAEDRLHVQRRVFTLPPAPEPVPAETGLHESRGGVHSLALLRVVRGVGARATVGDGSRGECAVRSSAERFVVVVGGGVVGVIWKFRLTFRPVNYFEVFKLDVDS